jgi:hypothetical protein
MDARVAFEPLLDAFGVPATVTRPAPDNDPIETVGIWLLPHNMDEPIASGFQRREPVRVFALSKDAVPTLPRNTRIEAPERAGGARQGHGSWTRPTSMIRITRGRCW